MSRTRTELGKEIVSSLKKNKKDWGFLACVEDLCGDSYGCCLKNGQINIELFYHVESIKGSPSISLDIAENGLYLETGNDISYFDKEIIIKAISKLILVK
jgi:hypothetical protein